MQTYARMGEIVNMLNNSMLMACILMIVVVCIFEFINGFHDTANAVATVIYTKTLKPVLAIIWSGLWNFLGVYIGGVAVAMSIMHIVPLHDLSVHGPSMSLLFIGCVLLSAIIRNLLTRYVGIPCSSSHTLIGAMIGASLGFFGFYDGVWVERSRLWEIGASLLISPLFGFGVVVLLLRVIHNVRDKDHPAKEKIHDRHVPRQVRALLIATCGLVSFSHGSNDGQKGVGLIMMILVSTFPTLFTFGLETDVAPVRVILLISCSLGIWTMIGRKRIVVTIGEKIWNTHLTYVQWAVSEFAAASTIGVSTRLGMPVSTTHVLSSAIAGSMVATWGIKNIHKETIMHIAMAWILTVPVSIGIAYALFWLTHTWLM